MTTMFHQCTTRRAVSFQPSAFSVVIPSEDFSPESRDLRLPIRREPQIPPLALKRSVGMTSSRAFILLRGERMSLSAIIVDDEQLARDELAYLLRDLDVDVVAQGKNGVEAVNLVKELSPSLVFLDVQMPGLDGFGVIKKLLDKKVAMPQIVFATAYDQYAVKAFEVNAVDYLLKPFDKKRVAKAVEKARQKLESAGSPSEQIGTIVKMLEQQQRPSAAKVLLKSAGRLFLVDQKDICYASIEDGVITVVATGMEGQSNCRTLEELLDSLDPNTFWRAHRSYLVNINRIKEVVPWFK